MACAEMMELEDTWKSRFERANLLEDGGMFAVPMTTVRQLRAKQAQAAYAILTHRRECAHCNNGNQAEPFMWSESRAS